MQKNTLPDQCWKTFAPKIAQVQFAQIHTGWTPLLISYVAYNHIHRRKKLQILVRLLFSFWLLPSIIFVGVIFEVHQNLPPTKKIELLKSKYYIWIFFKKILETKILLTKGSCCERWITSNIWWSSLFSPLVAMKGFFLFLGFWMK